MYCHEGTSGSAKKVKNNIAKPATSFECFHDQPLRFFSWVDHLGNCFSGHVFTGEANESDVWNMPRKAVTEMVHPTEKPEWLIMKALKGGSKFGNIVLDLFGGSGSTLMAAHKTGRIAYLMERDEKFCDLIRKRAKRLKM